MNQNLHNGKFLNYDFFSFPHNPEELFTLLYLIGKSENNEIYKAINNETRDVYCVKIISLDKNIENENNKNSENSSKLFFQKLKQETLLMKSIKNCENIVQYYGSFLSFKSKNIWLIYEYCPSGSLYDLMKILDREFTEHEISIIINDILHGLIYIHQLNIIHKNIKLTNILLNEKGIVKLNNFSKSVQALNTNMFNAYDKNSDESNDTKYDIFLLGLTCIELILGIKDKNFNRQQLIDKIKNNSNNIQKIIPNEYLSMNNKYISKEFKEFVKLCIEANPYKRPTAFELVNHPFIKNNRIDERARFIDIIRFNIEKIENNKKVNYISNKTKKKGFFYNSIFSNTKNTLKSNISINDKNKSSINISNINNNTNDNNTSIDKLAEFRLEEFKNPKETRDYDRYTNKDLFYSNIDNTNINNGTEGSLDNTMKESAVFGKGEADANNEEYEIKKKPLLPKNFLKKEENEDLKIDINNDIGNKFVKKDSEEFDFKANLDHLNKYEDIFKSQLSNKNGCNYNYDDDNGHILDFSEDQSIDINNKEEEIKQEKYIPFSALKCDVIQIGSSIQRNSKKSNYTSEFSLKNSIFKSGGSNDGKDNLVILSFGNQKLNEIELNRRNEIKDKNVKFERSTCFASFNSKINSKPQNENKSCKQLLHIRKSNFEADVNKIIDRYNKNNKNKIKNINWNLNDKIDNNFYSERGRIPFLYKYLDEFDVKKENEIKLRKTNIIRLDKIFNNKKDKKDNNLLLEEKIKNIVINEAN